MVDGITVVACVKGKDYIARQEAKIEKNKTKQNKKTRSQRAE
jgi:hypothetical protein